MYLYQAQQLIQSVLTAVTTWQVLFAQQRQRNCAWVSLGCTCSSTSSAVWRATTMTLNGWVCDRQRTLFLVEVRS
jgi:hypothetical protein